MYCILPQSNVTNQMLCEHHFYEEIFFGHSVCISEDNGRIYLKRRIIRRLKRIIRLRRIMCQDKYGK